MNYLEKIIVQNCFTMQKYKMTLNRNEPDVTFGNVMSKSLNQDMESQNYLSLLGHSPLE